MFGVKSRRDRLKGGGPAGNKSRFGRRGAKKRYAVFKAEWNQRWAPYEEARFKELCERFLMQTRLLHRLFPKLNGKWVEINLNELAVDVQELISPMLNQDVNPFLDPETANKWIGFLHKIKGVDFTHGGYLEDRSVLWAGHYMKPGEVIHLGVDFNVPAGTAVHLPVPAKLVYSYLDPDQNGGWGGKLIFQHDDIFFILGHLKNIVSDIGKDYPRGHKVGVVAEASCNGGWGPHLHVQCMKEFKPDVDGYGKHYPGIENDYPDPWDVL